MTIDSDNLFADRNLTIGAQRVLRNVVQQDSQNVNWFQRLLYELLSDDNQASEVVALDDESIDSIITGQHWVDAQRPESFAEWSMILLRHADRYAIQSSVEAMTGTEHLLLAAIELDSVTRSFVESHKVSFEQLVDKIVQSDDDVAISVAEDIQIPPASQGTIEESALFRILDASANRCREGLRVVEDYVRFALDDRFLSSRLKKLRHQLTESLRHLGQPQWVPFRDTPNDVGTTTTTTSEAFRGTAFDVVRASMKRIEESLRSLEEYSKVLNPDVSAMLEQSRYEFYSIEKMIETTVNARLRLADCRLYLLVTSENCRYGIEQTVRNTISAGVDVVQLREKSLPDRELIELAKEVRRWTVEHDTLLIINDRPDIAVACGADGVHLGQDDLSVEQARKIVGSGMLVGVSTHDLDQVREAAYAGADYLGVGPTFPSTTKEFTEFPGLEFVEAAVKETSLPCFAIGGIDEANLDEVLHAGATRIAVSSVICQAAHPRGISRDLAGRLVKTQ